MSLPSSSHCRLPRDSESVSASQSQQQNIQKQTVQFPGSAWFADGGTSMAALGVSEVGLCRLSGQARAVGDGLARQARYVCS
jgi:hypothetical protein